MKECVNFKKIGICEIDIEKAKKIFTLLNQIYQYRDEFYLLEYTPKGKMKFKVRISEESANELIYCLELQPFRDELFINSITYIPIA